ncbi:hypothetical protein ACP4OV_017355 [Aristida adscensionis]
MASSSGGRKRKEMGMCRSVWLRQQRAKTNYHESRVLLTTINGPPSQDTMPGLDLDKFPEDIFNYIHSLVPLRDAARAACVSRRFLRSWRSFPNLTFNWNTLGLNPDEGTRYEASKKLVDRIQHILVNHSGIGVEKFKLQLRPFDDAITANHLDGWLQAFIKSGFVELTLDPRLEYNFPCLLLSRAASSIQSIYLSSCDFHPTRVIGCFGNLKSVTLDIVNITEEELGCFLSCTISLEKLELSQCQKIALLKIPSHLQQFRILRVVLCGRLQMIEIYAPKITTLVVRGRPVKISNIDSSQLKTVAMDGFRYFGMLQYALTKLNSIARNLQTLSISSPKEDFNVLVSPYKFLQLRHLKLHCSDTHFQSFDFFRLIYFVKACPALETFFLSAGKQYAARKDSILKRSKSDPLHIRRIPGFCHDNLKKVSIAGFSSSTSLVELTCQILESASALQCLVLDTTDGYDNSGICNHMDREAVIASLNGVTAIERYIEGKVPSNVKFEFLKPCVPCHVSEL